MKKIVYLIAIILGTTIVGCNPLEDINNEIDAQDNPVVGVDEFTMSTDDYTAIVEQGDDEDPDYYETFEAFSNVDDAKLMLPAFLSDKYPYWGEGSSVTVNYNLYDGNPEDVSAYVNADDYELVASDYPTGASNAFFPNEEPTDFLEDVLVNQIASPTEGQIVLVEYDQYTEEPVVGFAPLIAYDFAGSFEGWSVVEESGISDVWTSLDDYIQGNGFFSGQVPNVEWLVSPSIDLSGETDLRFQIAHAIKYATDASLLKILVSTDYTGDTGAANWDEINLATTAGVDTLDPSEDYDFSSYGGETINIAFKYESTVDDAGRWRIASTTIKTVGITGPSITNTNYYKFDGSSWNLVDDVYYLTSADYDSMGTGSGQPGQYNNFSGSTSASNYLPQFLSIKYPFAQEEDDIFITYKYYGGSAVGTVIKGNLYTFTNGSWSPNISSLQFGFENGIWVPDNTIRYTLTNPDYEYIGNTLASDSEYTDLVGTLIDYHDYDYNWTATQVTYSLTVFLDYLDPSAVEGQKYQVTYLLYDNGLQVLTESFIKEGGEWIVN
ncbi:choice-of-anchor J domain-containing protein [Psychroserpens luteus]|uniref:Choice-of-anchor J domain-containing protein n=1 Tax=Psychroserpens luteus TaxID=1434066 RepID=A0ABW5ZY96_9FLAO|nr:choice-of-anchor J domain-containing protein [Psychroserpens luteus]